MSKTMVVVLGVALAVFTAPTCFAEKNAVKGSDVGVSVAKAVSSAASSGLAGPVVSVTSEKKKK